MVAAEELERFLLTNDFIKNDLSSEPFPPFFPPLEISLQIVYILEISLLSILSKEVFSGFYLCFWSRGTAEGT